MTDSEIAVVNIERELCKRDVCAYCGGRALGYHRIPEGPNEAGNYVHLSKSHPVTYDPVLCRATAIFARERFEEGIKKENICKACGCKIDKDGCGCNPHDA